MIASFSEENIAVLNEELRSITAGLVDSDEISLEVVDGKLQIKLATPSVGGFGKDWSTVDSGSMIFFDGKGSMTVIPVGSADEVLTVSGGTIDWIAIPANPSSVTDYYEVGADGSIVLALNMGERGSELTGLHAITHTFTDVDIGDGIVSPKSWHFNGTSDEMSFPASALFEGGSQFSVCVWFKLDAFSGSDVLLRATGTYLNLTLGATNIQWTLGDAAGVDIAHGKTLTDGKWHYVVLTYNATDNDAYVYMDGAQIDTDTGVFGVIGASWPITYIGSTGSSQYVDGYVDGVRFLRREIPVAEVLEVWTSFNDS